MKIIISNLFRVLFTSGVFLILLGSCCKDEMKLTGSCQFDCQIPAINLDTFYLSTFSKSFLPYTGFEKIVFVNGNMQEAIFTQLFFPSHFFYKSDSYFVCNPGDTIRYSIVREQLAVSHKCESLNLEYFLNILASTSFTKPLVIDMFFLTLHEPPHDFYIDTTINLNLVTDFRNNQNCLQDEFRYSPDVNKTSSVKLLGRVFENTYSVSQPTKLLTELYFNREFGIVGFKDIKGVLWRFERFE